MAKYFQIICLFTLFNSLFYSQNGKIQFEHVTVEDGLSETTLWCILQDSKGFLWVGTGNGLNRYDGYQFKVFRYIAGDSTSISNSDIRSILEDKSGILWIGTNGGGLNKFNREEESFTRYLHNPDDPTSISDNAIWIIYEDRSNILWIGTFNAGLNKFDKIKEQFISYQNIPEDPNSLSHNWVASICEDSDGNLWIGTWGGGLNILSQSERKKENPDFIRYSHDPVDPQSLSNNNVLQVYEDKNDILWIGTMGGGLNLLVQEKGNKSKTVFIHYENNLADPTSINNNEVVRIYEDRSGQLWIGTYGGGLNKLIKGINKNSLPTFKSIVHNPNDPSTLSTNITWSILEDNSCILWVGSHGGGLNKFNKKKKLFLHFKHDPNDRSSLSGNIIGDIYEDKSGILWIGTCDGGLNRFDRKTNTFKYYKHIPGDPSSLGDNYASPIYIDKLGIMWVATFNSGLAKFNPKTEKFIHYKYEPNNSKSISSNMMMDICEDDRGMMWIGTYDAGLNKFSRKTGEFRHYRHDSVDPNSLSSDNIQVVYLDKFGELWIGTNDGLDRYDFEKDNFIHYKHDPNNLFSISHNNPVCLYEDKSGEFWIGTNGGGLNKFNRPTEKFSNYKTVNGLPNDVIWGILEDGHGNLWLSTEVGLSKFNTVTETFTNYDVSDGLPSSGFEQWSYCKSGTGEMLFGGPNGFIIFHPDSIRDNEHIPPIYLTNFLLFNKPVSVGYDSLYGRAILKKSIVEADEIELTYEDKVFSFEFAALDFHVPEKNKYAYILEGFEENWNYTSADRRFATYTNLDPGEYTFRVKGSNNDGIWNEAGTSIKIIILPPWWATIWAYIAYAFLLISIVYATWKLQIRRVRIKHELEIEKLEAQKMHEVDEMKNRFFANISHEFRTPLTLILGPVKDILEKAKDFEIKQSAGMIKRNARRLYELVNQLLDLSKLEAGKMKLETSEENIIPFLKGLVLSFTLLAERNKITLRFNTVEENLNVYIDKDKIEKIVTNLLSNAFKFTPEGGEVVVSIKKPTPSIPLPGGDLGVGMVGEAVEISVKDSGIGIPKNRLDKIFDRFYQVDGSHTREREGTGIGLALTKELIGLHKGRIKVESEEGKGSTFTVLLPLGKDHLKPEEIVEKKTTEEEKVSATDFNLIAEVEARKKKENIDALVKAETPLILIVEDNADVRKYIISHLESEYRIVEAVDGMDGLQEALKHIPDLIISDVMMPKMDGFELCRKVKEDERTSHIPVIMLTAKATDRDKIGGYETGADDYIMKPFDTKVLQARIKNLIEIRRKLQEKFSSEDFIIPGELNSFDKQFLKRVLSVIDQHIADENFSIEILSKESAMSKEQIYKKLKALTGKSSSLFLRSVRLAKAKKMIKEQKGTISEISYSVGFSSPAYFTHCFKEEFGYSPSDLIT